MKDSFKELPLSDCNLKNNRVDIWQYSLVNEFSSASSLLNEEELHRAGRFHFARHRRRFTVAHAMLRLILAHYLKLPPSLLSFSNNQYGKPQLRNASTLQFNLSHSGELALLAIGSGFPLGIDLEFFSARPYEGIAQQLFSCTEIKALDETSRNMKPFIFFHIWSQKEAFIKACGLGLSYPTQQFDVPILPGEKRIINDALHQKQWEMISFMPQAACQAALCYNPPVDEIRYLKLNDLSGFAKFAKEIYEKI